MLYVIRKDTMPSRSEKQRRLMAAAAHDPKFAKKVGVPQSVAREFNDADARRNAVKRAFKQAKRR